MLACANLICNVGLYLCGTRSLDPRRFSRRERPKAAGLERPRFPAQLDHQPLSPVAATLPARPTPWNIAGGVDNGGLIGCGAESEALHGMEDEARRGIARLCWAELE